MRDYGKKVQGFEGGGAIPEVWSKKVINKGYPGTVLGRSSNTDYEKASKRKKARRRRKRVK
jgi:hypothetical protein